MFLGLPDKFWKRHYFPSLTTKDLLSLIQTSKHFNKQKKYIYRLIYIKLINFINIEEYYDNYDKKFYYPRDLTIYTTNVNIIIETLTLLNNNTFLKNMFIKATPNRKLIKKFIQVIKKVESKEITICHASKAYSDIINECV